MRILEINKYHYLKGGAERSYFDNIEVLTDNNNQVACFSMKHLNNKYTKWSKYFVDSIDYNQPMSLFKKIKIAGKFFYNSEANKKLQLLINDFQPQVAHLHNVYHQLSYGIIKVLKKNNIPIVMTLHDYKIISPNYNLFSKGKISYRGCGGNYYQIFLDKTVKNSWSKSLLSALEAYWYFKILRIDRKIDVFIAPSDFMKSICVRFGLSAEKIKVIPHFLSQTHIDCDAKNHNENYLLYFGRLSSEKGVDTLIKAMTKVDRSIKLIIIGAGPQEEELKKLTDDLNLNNRVVFYGYQKGKTLENFIQKARAIVVPSVWHEVFGYVVLESLNMGKIVIASDVGAMSELIQDNVNGFLFSAGDISSLSYKINYVLSLKQVDLEKNIKPAAYYRQKYNKSQYYETIMNIFLKLVKNG